MKWVAVVALALSVTFSAYAEDKKASLPPGESAPAVLILAGPNTKLVGKVQYTQVEEGGQQVQKPDPWVPGNVMIIREIDDKTAKGLKVVNGTAEVGGAYRMQPNHELEYLGRVDLKKTDKALAKQFGVKPEKKAGSKSKSSK